MGGTTPRVDPDYPAEAEAYREKIRAFLGELVLGLPNEPSTLPATWREQQAVRG